MWNNMSNEDTMITNLFMYNENGMKLKDTRLKSTIQIWEGFEHCHYAQYYASQQWVSKEDFIAERVRLQCIIDTIKREYDNLVDMHIRQNQKKL
jgi:hypothetical protein